MLSSTRQCRCCGGTFEQLLSLTCDRPDICPEDVTVQDNVALFATHGDVLTEDYCRIGELRFVRAVLAIPIQNSSEQEFILGTWASLSQDDFDDFVDMFETQDHDMTSNSTAKLTATSSRPAWLSNALPIGTSGPIACMLHPRPEGEYPELHVAEPLHELAVYQNLGASLEDLLHILSAYGHDLPSLVFDS